MKKTDQYKQPFYSRMEQHPFSFMTVSLLLLASSSPVLAAPVTNGAGTKATVTATALKYATEPAGSVSGIALTTQPVIRAEDAFGNLDLDYTNAVTLTESSDGTLAGASQATVSGIATFTGLTYSATTDGESFTVAISNDGGIVGGTASAINSDVVATKLAFTTQPAPTSLEANTLTAFTTVPVVSAVDANDVVDADFSETISLSANGTGSSTLANETATASSGVATFTGLSLNHDTAETLRLVADDQSGVGTDLIMVQSAELTVTANAAPTLVATTPTDDATNVATDTNLEMTLSESIVKGTGNILIKRTADDAVVDTIDVTGTQVEINNAVVTIDPSVILAVSTSYYIEVPATAFKDNTDNFFAGITDSTSWDFTTSTNKIVPSNHPTNFIATANATSVTTTWTDAVGDVLPDSYLVLCNTTNSFTPPTNGSVATDDTDCSDGSGTQVISAGSQSATWSGLTTGTAYFFTIYPFTNTDANTLYKTDGTALTTSATPSLDSDATVTAGDTVTEPVDLPSTTDEASEAVNLFDFKITDGGTSDGVSTDITQIVVRTSGSGDFSKITWRLTGNDADNVTGVYNESNSTLTFSDLTISIADGESETYIINAFFSNTSGITDNSTFLLSIDGANGDVTVDSTKTQMQPDAD